MDIIDLQYVGEKTAKLLNKLDINTDKDLISFYPYRYNIYDFADSLEENISITINCVIETNPVCYYIKKNFNRLSFRANINNIIVNVTIFNRAYLKNNLTIGKKVTLIGKYDKKKNLFTASDIKFNINNHDVEPVYHLVKGLSNAKIIKIIKANFNKVSIESNIPDIYVNKYNYLNKKESVYNLHFGKNLKDIISSRKYLVYEELFDFSFKMNYLKKINTKINKIPKNVDVNKINDFIKTLPFTLTEDQQKAQNDIINDLNSDRKMNRLILGDVGSGKTVVAVIAIYACFTKKYQSALMAPTEILALQHYYGIKKLLDKLSVRVEIITGSMTKTEKKKIYERVKNHEIDLLIGTHSILNNELLFDNLGLVITDEQHRFGVNQRSMLQSKSNYPDVLYLSATPIPRTYAMTIYGDLDISIIKNKPRGRKEIITKVKKESGIKDVLSSMLEQIKLGHQLYVVCPLVDQNDESDLTSVKELKNRLDLAFKGLVRSEIIYGKMKQSEKDSIMNDFKNNQVKILISTTVIEVGIDVPNATMMVIYNAERFGLATLHQLRGRVGRNDLQSYCILISNYDNERLKVMEKSNDGFYISEKDFELRGYGDLFGTKQSGDMSFKIANLKNDYDILVNSKNDSEQFIDSKEYLKYDYYRTIAENFDIVD